MKAYQVIVKIIRSNLEDSVKDIKIFEDEITEAIQNGFEPQGGVSIMHNVNQSIFAQAVYKKPAVDM